MVFINTSGFWISLSAILYWPLFCHAVEQGFHVSGRNIKFKSKYITKCTFVTVLSTLWVSVVSNAHHYTATRTVNMNLIHSCCQDSNVQDQDQDQDSDLQDQDQDQDQDSDVQDRDQDQDFEKRVYNLSSLTKKSNSNNKD